MFDNKAYDLKLGSWGPYNKEYLGICHIADKSRGATFNVELFPGFFRRSVMASKAVSDGGLKMWGADVSLKHFVYRYELEWKDRVYCDADFAVHNDETVDITCTFVNDTDMPQSVNMNLCAYLQYPMRKAGVESLGMLRIPRVKLPEGCIWIDAVDYISINCDQYLASDGKYLCEQVIDGASGKGTALKGMRKVIYGFEKMPIDSVGIRYKADYDQKLTLSVSGKDYCIELTKTDDFSYAAIEVDKANADKISIICAENVALDGISIGKNAKETSFLRDDRSLEPKRMNGDDCIYISYPGIDYVYHISWDRPAQMVRRFYCDDIGDALTRFVHNHVSEVIKSSKPCENVYENVLSEPLYLNPRERSVLRFTVRSGKTADFRGVPKRENVPEIYSVSSNSDGKRYEFSQNMMAYNTLLNVVYPVYTRRRFIRHNTPGRNWDSLYTWDSGFIGMGLLQLDFERAFDCLNTYLTPVGDMHSPYIFHGSVMPIQIFLYQALLNKFGSDKEKLERLKALYPMVKQYLMFFIDLDKDRAQTGSGLLKTWHIFYNSGGWDDYPPQKAMHANGEDKDKPNKNNTTPAVTTSVTVLISRIMSRIALGFGFEEDSKQYTKAAEKYSDIIQKYLWDEDCGYFSYMVHDENGKPKEFMRYKDGTNHNMGFDGIYPYIAGITNEYQNERIKENIKNGLLTDIGVGVVDKRAKYYSPHGYWNGSVWMPHQWILWRSLLDHSSGELAFDIAKLALDVWAREVNESYCCFEHFMSANGRGSGFHQFSGLSTPVMMFFSAYFVPGNITPGFMCDIRNAVWNDEKTQVSFDCDNTVDLSVVIVCMNEGYEYDYLCAGKALNKKRLTNGAWEINIPKGKSTIVSKICIRR